MSELTQILEAIEAGDPHAAEQLLPRVYGEFRYLAAQKLGRESLGQTLAPTALVHEEYLRCVSNAISHLGELEIDAMIAIKIRSANRSHYWPASPF